MAHAPQPNLGQNAPHKKMQKMYLNTEKGQNKKGSGHTAAKPLKKLHTYNDS